MKRKLNDYDVPISESSSTHSKSSQPSFESLHLDPRILLAVAKSNFVNPTPVQAQTIPIALEGHDILAQSKTGSGKTAAYVLPIVQSLLSRKQSRSVDKAVTALILVPTRELADQVTKTFTIFTEFCSKEIRALNLTQRVSDAVLAAKLQELPDVVATTPGRASQLVRSGNLVLDYIQKLVLDEADLLFSYGYEEDIRHISSILPKGVQSFLLSATLTTDVEQLSSTLCRNPVTIKVAETEDEKQSLTQYVVKCGEEEKFLLIYVIFKLKLVKGKTIIFVTDTDRCYRLKLYLEQFGIRPCVLNSELPVNNRLHVVEEFNKGLYDILIATDDQEVIGGVHSKSKPATKHIVHDGESHFSEEEDDDMATNFPKIEKEYRKDFGVSRGIDFQNVSCVLNFDLPQTSKSYTHRVGRTARAGQAGMALSFVIPRSEYNKHKYTTTPQSKHDERILEKITLRQAKKGNELTPYHFDTNQIEAFRYRMNDALRAVTRVAVREARAREIKQELIKSERLRKHFEENPEDLRHLRATGTDGGVVRIQSHMKHIPEYLVPDAKKKDSKDVGFVSLNGDESSKRRRQNGKKKRTSMNRAGGRRNDPLKSFKSKKK